MLSLTTLNQSLEVEHAAHAERDAQSSKEVPVGVFGVFYANKKQLWEPFAKSVASQIRLVDAMSLIVRAKDGNGGEPLQRSGGSRSL